MNMQMNPKLKQLRPGKIVSGVAAVLIVLLIGANSFVSVEYGHVGLYKTFGKLNDNTLSPGIHFKVPFIQTVIQVNTQVTKAETDTSASSKDLQPVSTHVAVNYSVNKASAFNLMNNIGGNFDNVIINPAIQEIVKEVTAKYPAEDLITRRDVVSSEISEHLTARLAKYDLIVNDINIVNFKFSEAFNQSIEAKQVAQQQALKAENDLRRIEIEAKQKIAQAQAEAESLRLKKQEVTPELVQLKQIEVQEKALEKWNGVLPSVTGGATPFVDIQSLTK
ncbi:HflC protein [Paenibacillus sp. VTT E-133280]|jgi:regulator of protease activity HflC (stomatin/prohibitin superfamily)|uniref:prohibitin family protein n=1 Tax=Paenibacillus TaxID=44249 RepID=UPI000BC9A3FD|nr:MULTISPECIES: prohibitin family protein [unclassified Paenibacillus]MDH6372437.1 prohibitin 2 [Paenibacillus sp. PastF-3]OZQ65049.1 HflC protein [Paenibacillus sp. VTT E-133280]OZQ89497.1 HflC protein [Paenibacillus sp. VTT E-133291]WHY18818.1 prohibitin family protein [Paenibacillus sp. G2S3]